MKVCKSVALMLTAAAIAAGSSCKDGKKITVSGLDPQNFVTEVDGKTTGLYTLTNSNGMEVCVTNFGGRIVSVMVPDRNGVMTDVVLGFDNILDYLPANNQTDFGASIGRYANRIAQGRIVIDGDTIQLPQNNYGHCLHGGPDGWQYKVYDAEQTNDSTVVLTLTSPDGDNNFPGTVNAKVIYTLMPDNAIDIAYEATTDKPTVINMTNHSYFNLNGDPDKAITDNVMLIDASQFTPTDSTFMTTGEIWAVEGTPMDFTAERVIGDSIDSEYAQTVWGKGYDHNWILNTAGDDNEVAVKLTSPETGIVLEVLTDEPGIQVYTGNFLDGTVTGKGGKVYNKRAAICLETQHYPDSPNKPEWPSVRLNPGDTYKSHCVFRFSTDK